VYKNLVRKPERGGGMQLENQSIGSTILKWIPNRMWWGELDVYLAWDIGIDRLLWTQ